jgi:2-hydroxychromene-2-carboxylate isomerase
VRYLSPEWFDAAGAALAADPGLPAATQGVRLTLQQTVTGAPAEVDADGEVTWRLVVDGSQGARLERGPGPSDVRFATGYATAAAIAAGELGAPTAFIRGDLRVGGDLTLLTAHHRALAAVHDVLAEVRKDTVR